LPIFILNIFFDVLGDGTATAIEIIRTYRIATREFPLLPFLLVKARYGQKFGGSLDLLILFWSENT